MLLLQWQVSFWPVNSPADVVILGVAHESVLKALDALSAANNETGRYDFWFHTFLATLEGRGKMGSLVGASADIKKHGGQESALTDYAVGISFSSLCCLLLVLTKHNSKAT